MCFFKCLVAIFILSFFTACSGGGSSSNTEKVLQRDDRDSKDITQQRFVVLNDTGVLVGGNVPGGLNATCIGETIAQQDCATGRDHDDVIKMGGRRAFANEGEPGNHAIGGGPAGFDFTKIKRDGRPLAQQNSVYSDEGSEDDGSDWSCVKDNHTGLMWEVKRNVPAGTHLHSNKDVFVYYNSDPETHAENQGVPTSVHTTNCFGYNENDETTLCNTELFISRVNAAGLCGAYDWRLPSINELISLVDYGSGGISDEFFPTLNDEYYWSSTNHVGMPNSGRLMASSIGKPQLQSTVGGGGAAVMLVRDVVDVDVDVSGPIALTIDPFYVVALTQSGDPVEFTVSIDPPYSLSAAVIAFPSSSGLQTQIVQIRKDNRLIEERLLTVEWVADLRQQ